MMIIKFNWIQVEENKLVLYQKKELKTEISAITITNLLGQSVKSFQISPATSVSVDVSDLAKGTYLVKVASAGNSQIVRVIKD